MDNTKTKWIYYLNFDSSKLPETFIRLSTEFSKLGYMFLPINSDQVHLFTQDKEIPYIVVFTSNLSEENYWRRIFHQKLNYFVLNKKIQLFHISSFNEALTNDKKNENYHFMKLPCKIDLLATRLAYFYENSKPVNLVWPGGRRAKVPV
jgi:hypothetical protein